VTRGRCGSCESCGSRMVQGQRSISFLGRSPPPGKEGLSASTAPVVPFAPHTEAACREPDDEVLVCGG